MGYRKKGIPFDRLVSRSYWIWRGSPALTVPTMFSRGLAALAESVAGIFVVALLIRLEGTPWLSQIAEDVTQRNFSDLVNLVSSQAFLYLAVEYLVPAAAIAIVILVVANGFVNSAEFGSYWQGRDGAHVGVSDVMSRFVEKWRLMAWTVFLSNLLTFLPLLAGFGFLLLVLITTASWVSIIVGIIALLIGVVLTPILALFFIYTPVAVAAEGLSGLSAIRRSWHQVSQNKGAAFAYSIVYIVLIGTVSFASAIIPYANLALSSLASVGILIMVIPVLHMTKTQIFAETIKEGPVEFEVYKPLFPDLAGPLPRLLWRKLLEGTEELKAFALSPKNFKYHLLSTAGIVLGWFLGVWIGNNGLVQVAYALGYVPGKINPLVTGSAPLTVGVYIFFHNWEASLANALSGIWFPAAPFVTLLLNGSLLGVVSDLVPNPTMLAAAILPHGIIELPSFVISGSAGIKLGVTFFRSFRNPTKENVDAFQSFARQTIYLIIGLALLFFVAGLIEGDITPIIMKMVGWT